MPFLIFATFFDLKPTVLLYLMLHLIAEYDKQINILDLAYNAVFPFDILFVNEINNLKVGFD